MKSLLLVLMTLASSTLFAAQIELITGDYGVQVRDRAGNIHHCTLEIQNLKAEQILILSVSDCPPKLVDIELYSYEDGAVYASDKIYVTTRRGGYKMYEIFPISETQFEMVSNREYGDGGVAKPRKVLATLK